MLRAGCHLACFREIPLLPCREQTKKGQVWQKEEVRRSLHSPRQEVMVAQARTVAVEAMYFKVE